MTRIFRLLPFLLGFIFAVSCASHPAKKLDRIQVGMDKDDVLKNSGSPWIARRLHGQDQWVYRYFKGDQQYHKEILFKNGVVAKVSSERPYPSTSDKLSGEDILEDAAKAKAEKDSYENGFKDVDSSGN
ncbi:MAG: outer membrane protein assembly factor BamE [Bdellovibrionales bacterium]|nr:outer membrane protein assembly factor BamE [Bdellovibrionales bacterium]